VTTDQPARHPGTRAIALGLAVLLAVHVLAFLLLLVLQRGQGETVLTGVHVEGEPVGGSSRDELRDVVADVAERRTSEPVLVVAGEGELRTDRAALGATADTDRTLERAWERGRRGLWRALWDQLRARAGAEVEVPVELEVDRDQLEAWAREAADELSRAPQDAAIAFVVEDVDEDAVTVEVTEPREGREVEPELLADEVEDALDEPGETRVELEVETEDPAITAADLDAVRADAERVVSGPLVLANPSDAADLVLARHLLAHVVAVEADPEADEGERLVLTSAEERLLEVLADGVEPFETDVTDAAFEIDGDQVEIVGGTPGFVLDTGATAGRILELARAEEGSPDQPREGELVGEVAEPEVTREELEELGIQEEVSSFTTELVPGESRNTNIQLGADIIAGARIAPGETFSLDEQLGPRTEERGFVENGFIDAEGELTEVVGGGTSQLATTFFNAAWFAGVRILDFKPHSLYFGRYPMGREATISRGTIDVVVENDSPHHVLIATEHGESFVTVRFFSTAWAEVDTWTGEPYDRVPGEVRDGFTVDFGRTITYPDGSTETEEYTHTYDPEDEPEDEPED
jgi:vancomycin resistance protein YoaR